MSQREEFFSRPWDSQPPGSVDAELQTPKSVAFDLGRRGYVANRGLLLDTQVSAQFQADRFGVAYKGARSAYLQSTRNLGITGNTPLTVAFWIKPENTGTGIDTIAHLGNTASNGGQCVVYANVNSSNIYVGFFNGDFYTPACLTANTWASVVVTYNGSGTLNTSTVSVYVNGVKLSLTNVGGTPTCNLQDAVFAVGRDKNNSGREFRGLIGPGYVEDRCWGVDEVGKFYANPWFKYPQRIFAPVAAAGGGSFTLALDAGSYTYTGQATGLVIARKLAFNAGSYAYTGQATTLSYGRKLSLDAGSYIYTGQSVGVTVARKLSFDAGSYNITGNDVTLTYDSSTDTYTLAMDAGSYTYTGQATDFKVSRKLSFDAGVYSYTGQTTNFAVGRKLSLDAGSYAYTGQATTFVVNRNLALDSGAYTYTGQAAGLAYSGSTGFVTIKAGSWLRYRVI